MKLRGNYHPKKRFGQNFLIDNNICDKIIKSCGLLSTDTVLEIGPGLSALTVALSQKAKSLIAVEIDRDLCAILSDYLSVRRNIKVVCCDFLEFDIAKLKRKVKIVGNLPFYITSPIIEHVINQRQLVADCFITVQKEVAQRIVARPGNKQYGSFSLFVQYYAEPKILFNIKKTCFWPRPEVDASLMRLDFREKSLVKNEDEKNLFRVIRTCFNQRRKKITGSLKSIIPKYKLEQALEELGMNQNIRPEDLSLKDFINILSLVKTNK